MKKIITVSIFLAVSISASSQSSGGQITRPQHKTSTSTKQVSNQKVEKPQAIDLGLPSGTLWADRNVGAKSPTAYGGLYRYGAPKTKMDGTNSDLSKLSNIIGTNDDVAMVNLGLDWRTPSREQAEELISNCKITNEVINGVKVKKFVGPNGNYILFPLAGIMYNYGRSQAGEFGLYMLGVQFVDLDIGFDEVRLSEHDYGLGWGHGVSVRAISSAKAEIVNNGNSSDASPKSLADNIQPTPAENLPAYNVVVSSLSILANAQMLCQKLRDEGYFSNIFFNGQLYRVIIGGSNILDMARIQKKNAILSYPGAFILCFENGQERSIN